MNYLAIFLIVIGFTVDAFAIPEFTESEKVYGADTVIIGQILSYYDEGKYRFYEILVMDTLSGELQEEIITMRSINESGFDPIDPYNVFEESDLVLLYLKDYGHGFWESTNFSKVIPEGQLQNTIDEMKVVTNLSLLPPLKQYKTGIPFNEIQCKQPLVLVQKHDETPACVRLDSVPKLLDREWLERINPQDMGNREMGYVSLYALSQYAESDQFIAVDFSGPVDVTQKFIDYFDVKILSTKITDDNKFSSNFGNMTKMNLKLFFEQNPPSAVIEQELSIYPLGGFSDNTGTYGPFNQFLSSEQSLELARLFVD